MHRRTGPPDDVAGRTFTAVDLCSGCGGLTTGLKRARFRVLGAVDNDRISIETYKANHSEVKVWRRDIASLSAVRVRNELRLRPGRLDLLAGCPPCQAFSSLRTLNGKHVVRDRGKDLLFHFLRFVKALRPKAIIVENVPGLAADRRIVTFCALLARLGYQSEIRILDAADYGVPQRRQRMILLACRKTTLRFASTIRKGVTVRDAIATLPSAGKSGDPLHDFPEKRTDAMKQLIRMVPRNGGSRSDLP